MRVIVTGALGFLGIHLTRQLAEAGAKVLAVDLAAPDDEARRFLGAAVQRVTFLQGNIIEPSWRRDAIDWVPDKLVHAAAVTPQILTEGDQAERIVAVNYGGTVAALEVARQAGVTRMINFSSSGVYGTAAGRPHRETDEITPVNLYAISKLAGEQTARRYKELFELDVISVRPGSLYGAMERPTDTRAGMSIFCQLLALARHGRKALISGADVGRDWLSVEHAATATVDLLSLPTLRHDCYNLGSDRVITLLEAAETVRQVVPDFHFEVAADAQQANVVLVPEQRRAPLVMDRLADEIGFVSGDTLRADVEHYWRWLLQSAPD